MKKPPQTPTYVCQFSTVYTFNFVVHMCPAQLEFHERSQRCVRKGKLPMKD